MGIMQPYRNLGGRFDLGWPHLCEVLSEHVTSVVREGRRMLMMSSYHFSKGDPHRGCAGFNYDTEAAREPSPSAARSSRFTARGIKPFIPGVRIRD